MSESSLAVVIMVGSMALMVLGIIAARCWENVQHHKIEVIDAELINLEWSPWMPTEEGFYWFKGTIEYGPEKYDNQLFVFVVHSPEERTSVNEGVVCEDSRDDDDACEYKYTGHWAKLEKPI